MEPILHYAIDVFYGKVTSMNICIKICTKNSIASALEVIDYISAMKDDHIYSWWRNC